MSARPRRLVFGEVAELYDAARPTYPEALVDDLAAWARDGDGPPSALEVGAGTGKATRLLAARGVAVLAVEPSAEMAAVARRTTAASGLVEVIESDFEHAELEGRRFALVYAAQAWHWVEQPAGYARAREALLDGGRLVAVWNRPVWGRSAVRAALDAAYDRFAADLPPGLGRPADRYDVDMDWVTEIAGVDGFGDPEVRTYEWSLRYTPEEYVDLVATHSELRMLAADRRDALLAAIRAAIAQHGGALELPMRVRACVARAV
jgi:SAM-dependent methyltransferase